MMLRYEGSELQNNKNAICCANAYFARKLNYYLIIWRENWTGHELFVINSILFSQSNQFLSVKATAKRISRNFLVV